MMSPIFRLSWATTLCLLASGCGASAPPQPLRQPPVVTVSTPVEMEVVDYYYAEGYTDAVSTVDIRARVSGYLERIYFRDGEDVKEGAPLFLIDPRPYKATLDQSKAELARGQALAKRLAADQARAETLLPRRTISQQEYDKVAAKHNEAEADVKAKEAAVEQADLNLHFAAIKAPISGRISRHLVPEGNLVAANETLLTTIVSVEPIYVYFDVDEPTVLHVQKLIREGKVESAREAKVTVDMGLDIDIGYPYQGVIDFVENRVDPKTGTLKIRAVFPNKDHALSAGLHAKIRLPLGRPYTALAISERAIGTFQGQKFVYLVDDANKVVERPVRLGTLQKSMRVVADGLTAADRVIVNGLQRVRPGVTVDPQPAETTAQSGPDRPRETRRSVITGTPS